MTFSSVIEGKPTCFSSTIVEGALRICMTLRCAKSAEVLTTLRDISLDGARAQSIGDSQQFSRFVHQHGERDADHAAHRQRNQDHQHSD